MSSRPSIRTCIRGVQCFATRQPRAASGWSAARRSILQLEQSLEGFQESVRRAEAINRNADIASELARRAAARGRIGSTPQAFGKRAHLYFERLNKRLNERLSNRGSRFRVSAEEFRSERGRIVPRNTAGSIGGDAVVTNTKNARDIAVFDLKTYEATKRPIPASRQHEFKTRFGSPAEELYRKR
jgi:hypothetical protein